LEVQRTIQEISLARRIQASFLPEAVPEFSGWQLAATLEPARQIAGDFYDFIPLPDGRMAILIADVADKGFGPALYMALSRTLIRTYATQYESQPAEVLSAANRRIILDARANLFVTVFYGVLDLTNGELIYANAGHTPPYLFHSEKSGAFTTLKNTGMPLGIDEDSLWGQEEVIISPGDILLLYTDGVTDAQNEQGEFIDRRAILDFARRYNDLSIPDLQRAILHEIHTFVGSAPRFDDITLVIIGRDGQVN
jgi:sigma-B regulation protein RsbU (phosphoserine phosphatase)